jgi:hypothetical protein
MNTDRPKPNRPLLLTMGVVFLLSFVVAVLIR